MTPEEQARIDAVTAKLTSERYYIRRGQYWRYIVWDSERPDLPFCATDDYDEALKALAELRGK